MQPHSVSEFVSKAEECLRRLNDTDLSVISGSSHFIRWPRKRDRHSGWRFITLSANLRSELQAFFTGQLKSLSERSVSSLEFDAVTKENMGVLPSSDFFEFSDGIDNLPDPVAEGATFDGSEEFLSKTKAFSIRLDLPEGRTISCFLSTGSNFLLRTSTWARISEDRRSFKSGPDELIIFPQSIAFFIIDEFVFVANDTQFSSITHFTEAVKKSATEAVEFLLNVPNMEFADPDLLKSQVFDSVEFMRRLSSAYKAGALKDRNVDRIQDDIKEYGLDIETELENGVLSIQPNLTTRKGRRDLVDVLADRFAKSPSSGISYRMQKASPIL